MKKLFIVILILSSTLSGYAQLTWNVKAGANFSKETGGDGAYDLKPGFQVGVGADYFWKDNWGVQSALQFTTKGYIYDRDFLSDSQNVAASAKSTINHYYLELPVMLAYKVKLNDHIKLILNGGVYTAYGVGGKYKYVSRLKDGSTSKESESGFQGNTRWDFGLTTQPTLEFRNRYTVGLFGQWGLIGIYGSDSPKNQTYGVNIGYKF